MTDNSVHVTAANSQRRRAAGLTFERNQSKRFLNARMNEKIGRAIIACEIGGVCAILNPWDSARAPLQLSKLMPLRSVPNHEQVKIFRPPPLQELKTAK